MKERRSTYMELNRGLISGIEKRELLGEKYELPQLENVEPLRLD